MTNLPRNMFTLFLALTIWGSTVFSRATAAEPQLVGKAFDDTVAILKRSGLSVSPDEISAAALESLTLKADPGRRILTLAEDDLRKEQGSGYFFHPGFVLSHSNGQAFVLQAPPEDASLVSGRVVLAINGVPLSTNGLEGLHRLLFVEGSTSVVVDLAGPTGTVEKLEVPATRRRMPSVAIQEVFPTEIGYLKLFGLFEHDRENIFQALEKWTGPVEKSGKRPVVTGLLFDLRDAGGDSLDAAVGLAATLVPAGSNLMSMLTLGSGGERSFPGTRTSAALIPPVVVLVNSNTTGAAELFAAILMHAGPRVLVVGQPTNADPLVRDPLDLPDGRRLYLLARKFQFADGFTVDGARPLPPDLLANEHLPAAYAYQPRADMARHFPKRKNGKDGPAPPQLLHERVRGDNILTAGAAILRGIAVQPAPVAEKAPARSGAEAATVSKPEAK